MAGEATSKSLPHDPTQEPNPPIAKKRRNLPGNPDPEAEVIALSPKTLLATNRFVCEICGKGFQRDQNLQLHRRGHNLPWKLRQRSTKERRKRVYVCPEKTCIHHHPSRALGDLTGVKKHFCRKHGEKKWKCEKCSKRYAVQSDWKAHSKVCGTREYRCDCGTLFSRRDSFITHRAFCDALAEEAARVSAASNIDRLASISNANYHFTGGLMRSNMVQHFPAICKPAMAERQAGDHALPGLALWMGQRPQNNQTLSTDGSLSAMHQIGPMSISTLYSDPFASCSNAQQLDGQLSWIYGNKLASSSSVELTSTSLPTSLKEADLMSIPSLYSTQHHQQSIPASDKSATALLQKAAQIGATSCGPSFFGSLEMKCHNTQVQDGSNKYDGLLDPNHPSIAANMENSLENIASDITVSNPYSDMHSARHQMAQKDGTRGGETRDFLGVGVQTLCPSSANGWI